MSERLAERTDAGQGEFLKRLDWVAKHPVLALAAVEEGAHTTHERGLTRLLCSQVLETRPDIKRELDQLQPKKRNCPHCRAEIAKEDERCASCGKFVPAAEKVVKAELSALLSQPDSGESRVRVALGDPAVHEPSGFRGRFVGVTHDARAVLRNPSGDAIQVPVDEIEAEGSLSDQSLPGGRQGSFDGSPASHDKQAAFFASPEGMLKLARGIPGPVGLFGAAPGRLRKGGSIGFVRGQHVKNRRTGQFGISMGTSGGRCGVEYNNGVAIEDLADLVAA